LTGLWFYAALGDFGAFEEGNYQQIFNPVAFENFEKIDT